MAFIEWTEEMSVHILELDNQHKDLISYINDLHGAVTGNENASEISNTLTKLVDYTVYHFKAEEDRMSKAGFADFDSHKKEHDVFAKKLLTYQEEYQNGSATIVFEILEFVVEWLNRHVRKTDQKYSSFLAPE